LKGGPTGKMECQRRKMGETPIIAQTGWMRDHHKTLPSCISLQGLKIMSAKVKKAFLEF